MHETNRQPASAVTHIGDQWPLQPPQDPLSTHSPNSLITSVCSTKGSPVAIRIFTPQRDNADSTHSHRSSHASSASTPSRQLKFVLGSPTLILQVDEPITSSPAPPLSANDSSSLTLGIGPRLPHASKAYYGYQARLIEGHSPFEALHMQVPDHDWTLKSVPPQKWRKLTWTQFRYLLQHEYVCIAELKNSNLNQSDL